MNPLDMILAAQSMAAVQAPPVLALQTNPIADRIAAIAEMPKDYSQYADIQRITNIPTFRGLSEAEVFDYNLKNVLSVARNDGFKLNAIQCEVGSAYEALSIGQAKAGLLCPIGVGVGKTLSSMLIYAKAWAKGIEHGLLMIPPSLLHQFAERDIKWVRSKIPINYPIHILGGREMAVRKQMASTRRKGLYVWTYSLLSAKDASFLLKTIKPGIVIADEAHKLAKMSAARSRRIRDYIDEYSPEFAAMSGTITNKSVRDYYHFAKWALDQNCPLPLASALVNEWSCIIDAEAGHSDAPPAQTGPIQPLVDWAKREFPNEQITDDMNGFRRAYRLRLNSVRGVVSSGDADLKISLTIANVPIHNHEQSPGWKNLKHFVDQIEEAWLTPNGDEINHAIHKWKWLYELGCGFYNQLTWPDAYEYSHRKNISQAQAEDYIGRAKTHHAALQMYDKDLRKWLENCSHAGFDTPFLVGSDFQVHKGEHINPRHAPGSTIGLYQHWLNHKALEFDFMPERDSTAIRVCPYKIDAALEWATNFVPKGEGAIFWCYHREVGRWMAEALTEEGFDVLHCPAGAVANKSIGDPANKNRMVVASIKAHGEGKNLQHFHNQYCIQWPRSAVVAEQMIGRTHRQGQMEDEIIVHTNNIIEFDVLNFAATLNDSLYIHQTTGNKQKLIIAGYDPLPKIYSSSFLRERGLEPNMLSSEQAKLLAEKFVA